MMTASCAHLFHTHNVYMFFCLFSRSNRHSFYHFLWNLAEVSNCISELTIMYLAVAFFFFFFLLLSSRRKYFYWLNTYQDTNEKPGKNNRTDLSCKVLSSWGTPHVCGITEKTSRWLFAYAIKQTRAPRCRKVLWGNVIEGTAHRKTVCTLYFV